MGKTKGAFDGFSPFWSWMRFFFIHDFRISMVGTIFVATNAAEKTQAEAHLVGIIVSGVMRDLLTCAIYSLELQPTSYIM